MWYYRETSNQRAKDSEAKTYSEAVGQIKQQFVGQKTEITFRKEGVMTIMTIETAYEIIEFEIWEG